MPKYSEPSASPRAVEFVSEHGLDLVAVMQRTAGVGHDDFADVEALQDFDTGVGYEPDPDVPHLDGVALDDLNRQLVDPGARNPNPATALGVDAGAGEHADLERWVAGQRYPDVAELVGPVDLRRNQPD